MMSELRSLGNILGLLAGTTAVALPSFAAAQSSGVPGTPSPALPGAIPNAPGGGGEAWVSALFVVSGLIVIVGAAAKLSDIRGKREAEAARR